MASFFWHESCTRAAWAVTESVALPTTFPATTVESMRIPPDADPTLVMRRTTVIALLLVLATPALGSAQDRASAPRSGGTIIVLDSVELRGAGGQTLAAFLAGRVPGVTIGYTTGLESATPRVISRGTYGTMAAPEPLLYVDGVLWKDDAHMTGSVNDVGPASPAAGLTPPSVGWGLPIEEVAEIRVHLGLSSGLSLEERGSRGVVHVTTHRPVAGATTIRASLWTSVRGGGSLSDPNVGTYGTIAGAPTVDCTLARQADGTCTTPGARLSWDPVGDVMPYQASQGIRAAVSATSTFRGWGYRVSALRDLTEGALPGGHSDRADLALATSGTIGGAWDLTFDARYALSRGRRMEWDGSGFVSGLTWAGPNPDDPFRADMELFIVGLATTMPRRESDRISVGARATRRISSATALELTASQDLLRRESFADWPDTWFIDGSPLTTVDRSDFYQRDASVSAMATHTRPIGRGLSLDSRAGVRYRRTASNEYASTITCCVDDDFFPPSFGSSTRLWPVTEFTNLVATSRLDLWGRGMVGVGLRQEALLGTRTSPTMKSAEASWDLIATGADRGRSGLARLVVRAGYGENVDDRVPIQRLIFAAGPGPRWETAIDREVALDANWFGRLETSVAYSVTTVTGGAIGQTVGIGFPPLMAISGADWRVDAILARASLRSRDLASMPWRVGLSALSRRPVLQNLTSPPSCGGIPGTLIWSCTEEGSALGRPRTGSHTYADMNDDGIIAESEVTIGGGLDFAGSPEPSWVLALAGDVAMRPGVRMGAVIESHLGQAAVDLAELQRCRRDRCSALHDPSTSLAEQAAAVAAGLLGQEDISGFVRDASFVRVREVHVSWTPSLLRGSTIRLAAHQLLAWTRFPTGDPEAMPRNGAIPTGAAGFHEGIRPSFSVRIEMAPLRR